MSDAFQGQPFSGQVPLGATSKVPTSYPLDDIGFQPMYGQSTGLSNFPVYLDMGSAGSLRAEGIAPSGSAQSKVEISRQTDDVEERLFDAKSTFKVTASQIAMHLGLDLRNRLFAQIDRLLAPEDWDERDAIPKEGSYLTLLRLLLLLAPRTRPGLGATYDGHLIAAWTAGREHLTIEALENDRVRWTLNRFRNGTEDRASGTNDLLRLPKLLAEHEPHIWFD